MNVGRGGFGACLGGTKQDLLFSSLEHLLVAKRFALQSRSLAAMASLELSLCAGRMAECLGEIDVIEDSNTENEVPIAWFWRYRCLLPGLWPVWRLL